MQQLKGVRIKGGRRGMVLERGNWVGGSLGIGDWFLLGVRPPLVPLLPPLSGGALKRLK